MSRAGSEIMNPSSQPYPETQGLSIGRLIIAEVSYYKSCVVLKPGSTSDSNVLYFSFNNWHTNDIM